MRTIQLCLIALIFLFLNSCEKDEGRDKPGDIPGMGDTPGELAIKETFSFPSGVALSSEIIESLNPDIDYSILGSGNHLHVKLTLLNANNFARTVFFPRGLLLTNSNPERHNALLVQTTWVTIEANSERKVKLHLYCINKTRFPALVDEPYSILGITDSRTINDFLELMSSRKINYEMVNGTFNPSKSENTKSGPTYDEISEHIQFMVWNMTEYGTNPSESDKAFINSIPQLSPSEIPPEPYPDTFPEFVVTNDL